MTDHDPREFAIEQERVEAYFRWQSVLFPMAFPFVFPLGMFLGLGLVLAAIWWLKYAAAQARARTSALHYWIDEGGTLRVDRGVLFRQRLAIPLDRVTDVVLYQDPLMQWCGVWCLIVRTSGFNGGIAAAQLIGLRSPEKVRDLILAERRKLLGIEVERFA